VSLASCMRPSVGSPVGLEPTSARAPQSRRGADSTPCAGDNGAHAERRLLVPPRPTPESLKRKLGYTEVMVTLYDVGPGFGLTSIRMSSTLNHVGPAIEPAASIAAVAIALARAPY
jgi:hypothetical protein